MKSQSFRRFVRVTVVISRVITFRFFPHHLLQASLHILKIDINRFLPDIFDASLDLHLQLDRPLNFLLEKFAL